MTDSTKLTTVQNFVHTNKNASSSSAECSYHTLKTVCSPRFLSVVNTQLQGNNEVHIAYSGGPDSTALFLFTAKLMQHKLHLLKLHHMDHGIRSDTDDVKIVTAMVEKIACPLTVHKPTEDLSQGPCVEERARDQRRNAFGPEVITAHHADDNVETMLMNMLRGTGLRGAGIPQSWYKPFLKIRKSQLLEFLDCFSDVKYITDSTNAELHYRRNRIRHEVIPLLNEIANKDVTNNLNSFSQHCATAENTLVNTAMSKYRDHGGSLQWKHHGLNAEVLDKMTKDLRIVLLRKYLMDHGIFTRQKTIEGMDSCILALHSKYDISGEYRLVNRSSENQEYYYLEVK